MTTTRFFALGESNLRVASAHAPEVVRVVGEAYGAFEREECEPAWRLTVEPVPGSDCFCVRDETGAESRAGDERLAWLMVDFILRGKYLAAIGTSTLMLHAAALAQPGRGACVFIAPSGGGKSTLAAALVARGWRLLSDEVVEVDERCAVRPFPRLPSVDECTAHALTKRWPLLGRVPAAGVATGYLRLPQGHLASPGERHRVRGVLILCRTPGGPKQVNVVPLRPTDGALQILGACYHAKHMDAVGFGMATDRIRQTRVWRLEYRDVLEQGDCISEWGQRILDGDG